ncbi:hypothetical protein ccbrp13_25160 [Ktedonobacteria bacterium brp13]|nr:hypothetical protein ccbrp13_25160 [Ktedonobacteria bacterium brp13]
MAELQGTELRHLIKSGETTTVELKAAVPRHVEIRLYAIKKGRQQENISLSTLCLPPSRPKTLTAKLTANTFVSSGETWNLPDSFWEFELRMDGNGLLWRGYTGEEMRQAWFTIVFGCPL